MDSHSEISQRPICIEYMVTVIWYMASLWFYNIFPSCRVTDLYQKKVKSDTFLELFWKWVIITKESIMWVLMDSLPVVDV